MHAVITVPLWHFAMVKKLQIAYITKLINTFRTVKKYTPHSRMCHLFAVFIDIKPYTQFSFV
jgi:hypothetical protein